MEDAGYGIELDLNKVGMRAFTQGGGLLPPLTSA